MKGIMKRFVKEEEGQGLVEYALIIVLVALAVMGTLTLLAGNDTSGIKGVFYDAINALK